MFPFTTISLLSYNLIDYGLPGDFKLKKLTLRDRQMLYMFFQYVIYS